MKQPILPIPVDAELDQLVRQGAETTGLKLANVMRQGLRLGIPALVDRLRVAEQTRKPACLDYLDDYPRSSEPAVGYRSKLKARLAKKYGHSDR